MLVTSSIFNGSRYTVYDQAYRMEMKLLIPLYFVVLATVCVESLKIRKPCPCSDREYCSRKKWPKQKVEAYIVTEGKSQYKNWDWDYISMALALNYTDTGIMCHAHKLNKGYGFIERIPELNTSKSEFSKWLAGVRRRVDNTYADGVALDLLDHSGKCDATEQHVTDVTNAVSETYKEIKRLGYVQLICILPWKPPCYDNNCGLTANLIQYCDTITTSPDSYTTFCDLNCKARATVPKSKLVLGLDEYISSGVMENRLMMGIPWHGYDYTCETFKKTMGGIDICTVPKLNDTSGHCDFKKSRRRLSLGFIMDTYSKYFNNHNWHARWAAPYFNYGNIKNNQTHQVWFEGYDSLSDKYLLAKELGIQGVMIWTGDDLSNKDTTDMGDGIWYWLVHTLFLTGDQVKDESPSFAGKAAGIGVGCFIGGCVIGFLVTCIATQRTVKNLKLRRPFDKDLEEMNGDTYHDDDNL